VTAAPERGLGNIELGGPSSASTSPWRAHRNSLLKRQERKRYARGEPLDNKGLPGSESWPHFPYHLNPPYLANLS